jgi:acetyl esterase/lipase
MSHKPTRTVVYKTVGTARLKLHVFEPEGHKPTDKRPAVVFFFGGGWVGGTPTQFFPQCAYLASRGMVAASAEYRVKSRHGVTPFECVTDGKSAVRYLRAHAGEMGIDPDRIAAGGGSAGGHVAACTGTIQGMDEKGEDASISSCPNAMLLFNPATMLDFEMWKKNGMPEERLKTIKARFDGRDAKVVSPVHHVEKGAPPTILFHGEEDKTVSIRTARAFTQAMTKAGNRCDLKAYPGQGHGFFNAGRGDAFPQTLREADAFLVSLGWLEGKDTVDQFIAGQ